MSVCVLQGVYVLNLGVDWAFRLIWLVFVSCDLQRGVRVRVWAPGIRVCVRVECVDNIMYSFRVRS